MKVLLLIFAVAYGQAHAQSATPMLEIQLIDRGVYLHRSFKEVNGYGIVDSNGLIILDGKDAYIIDTPWSEGDTKMLLAWMKGRGFTPVAALSTHSHEDRTAGIAVLNAQSIPTYASSLTNRVLALKNQAVASNTFNTLSTSEFALKSGLIETFYPGPGHSEDNLVVWLPQHNILFGGCMFRGTDWDNLGNIEDASLSLWSESITRVKEKYGDAQVVIPGHGDRGKPRILDHTLALVQAAED